MPLQLGNWQLNLNGVPGTLTISSVDAQGNVAGTITGGPSFPGIQASGFWNELAQELTVWVVAIAGGVSPVFRGCLFPDTMRISGVSGAVLYTLAGLYELPPGHGGSAHQNVFGWYAQIGVD